MATLGQSSTSFSFTVFGSFDQFAGGTSVGYYTVPNPGIYPTNLEVYARSASGSATTARNYVWLDSSSLPGTAVYSNSSTYSLGTSLAWQGNNVSLAYRNNATGFSDGYIPGGTKIWLGIWASNANYEVRGDGSNLSELGTGGDGNWVQHGAAGGGFGGLAAILTYNPAAPQTTGISPNQIYPGESVTLTGYAYTGATGVSFNGVAASTFTVNSNTSITVTVPSGISAGNVTVSNSNGTGSGAAYTLVGGYVLRSGVWTASQGTFVFRSGAWSAAQGVFVLRSGVWQPSQ